MWPPFHVMVKSLKFQGYKELLKAIIDVLPKGFLSREKHLISIDFNYVN